MQNNPLVKPLHDVSGRNRTVTNVFNDCLKLREDAMKSQEEYKNVKNMRKKTKVKYKQSNQNTP